MKGNKIKDFFNKLHLYSSNVTFDYTNESKFYLHNNEDINWKVTLIDTGLNSMTGGRTKRIQDYIDSDTFMLTYGDGLSYININDLIRSHIESKKMLPLQR